MLDFIFSFFSVGASEDGKIDILGVVNTVFGVFRSLFGLDQERYVL